MYLFLTKASRSISAHLRRLSGAASRPGPMIRRGALGLLAHARPLGAAPTPRGAHSVAFLGSGNWGSAAARIAAQNALRLSTFEVLSELGVYSREWRRRAIIEGGRLPAPNAMLTRYPIPLSYIFDADCLKFICKPRKRPPFMVSLTYPFRDPRMRSACGCLRRR